MSISHFKKKGQNPMLLDKSWSFFKITYSYIKCKKSKQWKRKCFLAVEKIY